MDYSIVVPSGVMLAGSLIFCVNVWWLSRIVARLFERLDDADAFIRASANTQAYLTVQDRKEEVEKTPVEEPQHWHRVIE